MPRPRGTAAAEGRRGADRRSIACSDRKSGTDGRAQRTRAGGDRACSGQYRSGGAADGHVEPEGLDLADVVAELTVGVGAGGVVAGAEVGVAGGGVGEQVPDDDQDGPGDGDLGLGVAAAGDP